MQRTYIETPDRFSQFYRELRRELQAAIDGGKATVAGKEFDWTVVSGVIQLKHASGYASFGACARDIYLDSKNYVLWEVAPPGKR